MRTREALIWDFDRDGAQGGEGLLGFDHDVLEDAAEEEGLGRQW